MHSAEREEITPTCVSLATTQFQGDSIFIPPNKPPLNLTQFSPNLINTNIIQDHYFTK